MSWALVDAARKTALRTDAVKLISQESPKEVRELLIQP